LLMTEFARQNGAAQCDDLFPATQGKHGKKFVWAQNRQNSSQIDPCNQVLISSSPVGRAGKKSSLLGCRQGNGREKIRIQPGIDPVNGEKRPLDHTLTHLFGPFPAVPGRELRGIARSPRRRPHRSPLLVPPAALRHPPSLEIIRVNLDAKMAAPPSRRRRRRSGLFAQLDNSLIYRSSSEQQKAARCRR
jgi:hypothetical protein